jgi:mersacidin/lichenicidin family type 2 lantibiotic
MIESDVDVVRAWKDEEYRESLGEAQRAAIPENPAGLVTLDSDEMRGVLGGLMTHPQIWSTSYCANTDKNGECLGTVRIGC